MTINEKEYEVQDHGEYVTVKVGDVWLTVPEGASIEDAVKAELKHPTKFPKAKDEK